MSSCTHQTSLSKEQLDSCLAGSSPAGWTDLVQDLCDGRFIPRSHSVLAQCLLNELQHRVLRETKKYSTKCVCVPWKACQRCSYLLRSSKTQFGTKKWGWPQAIWASVDAYHLQFEVFSSWLVKGHSLEEVGADLHRDSGKLTLDGLRHGLDPARLLGLHITAAALYKHGLLLSSYFSIQMFHATFTPDLEAWTHLQSCLCSFGVKMEASLQSILPMSQTFQSCSVGLHTQMFHSCQWKQPQLLPY